MVQITSHISSLSFNSLFCCYLKLFGSFCRRPQAESTAPSSITNTTFRELPLVFASWHMIQTGSNISHPISVPHLLLVGDGVGRRRRLVVTRACSTTTLWGIAFSLCQLAYNIISLPYLTPLINSLLSYCLRLIGGRPQAESATPQP